MKKKTFAFHKKLYSMKILNLLILTLTLAFGMCSCNSSEEQVNSQAHFETISSSEFKTKQADGNTVVLDVRTPGEVASGYIAGTQFFADFNGSNFDTELDGLDKNKTYLVYCRSGNRSSKACQKMIDKGFKNVYNLESGITGWADPLVTQ